MKMRNIVLAGSFVAGCLLGTAPFTPVQAAAVSSQQSVPLIEPASLHAMMTSRFRVYILDVRQPEEFNQGHIQGAVLMPLDTLPNSYRTLPKSGKLVVYCRSGRRSAQAVLFLREHGYSNAVSLSGGYTAWANARY